MSCQSNQPSARHGEYAADALDGLPGRGTEQTIHSTCEMDSNHTCSPHGRPQQCKAGYQTHKVFFQPCVRTPMQLSESSLRLEGISVHSLHSGKRPRDPTLRRRKVGGLHDVVICGRGRVLLPLPAGLRNPPTLVWFY